MSKPPKGGSRTDGDEDTIHTNRTPTGKGPEPKPGKPFTDVEVDTITDAVMAGKTDKQIKAMIAKMFKKSD